MSRKDTIIVALLINAGLLALLFMLAINTDEESISDYPEINKTLTESRPATKDPVKTVAIAASKTPSRDADEVDTFLNELSSDDAAQTVVIDEDGYVEFVKEPAKIASTSENKNIDGLEYVEVTVKRGDALEKIARNNGTTVEAIKKANGIASTKLSIGQTLKIPVSKTATTASSSTPSPKPVSPPKPAPQVAQKPAPKAADTSVAAADEPVYYTMKSGDTPWKIAKQHNVNFDELLKLNGLNEERARNLKPGDKIRVK